MIGGRDARQGLDRIRRTGGAAARAAMLALAWLVPFSSLGPLGCEGRDLPAGEIHGAARPAHLDTARRQADRDAGGGAVGTRILFGDLHVHTTFSIDAFVFNLPVFGGEGTHPPADACDFARHCSGLDFFSLNDHAEGLTPERWNASIESLRECRDRSGDPSNPDLVPFLGWEWTQAGSTPETHYGHKNVVLRGLEAEAVPTRPISSLDDAELDRAPPGIVLRALQGVSLLGLEETADFLWWIERLSNIPNCERGVHVRDLPPDCRENAPTPAELFRKLDEWGHESIVIPHGLVWGEHAPPGSRLDSQLRAAQHDPDRQRLLEIYSGHGNSEEYRAALNATDSCPEPTPEHLACCWRAGEIMRSRCGDLPEATCDARVREAHERALAAGPAVLRVFPDVPVEDWLDCDQCRDCFKSAMSPRSGLSAQYSLAAGAAEPGESEPRRFRWGFVASSDDHRAQPGTGYKQIERRSQTDARGLQSPRVRSLVRRFTWPDAEPDRAAAASYAPRSFGGLLDVERVASFMYPGGLVAAHVRDPSEEHSTTRASLWEALLRREVYATSGPRILLWFDLTNGPQGGAPMGSEVDMDGTPSFEVRAVGARVQRPGCPAESLTALGAERLERLCQGECHHPGDARHAIAAIEIVRIRPRISETEPMADRIEDPWLRFECPADAAGCIVGFEDPEYATAGRDTVYYARALQEETPAINGANLRAETDASGNTVRVAPCFGDARTAAEDDCLAPVQERAWSSPIFVDRPR